MKPLLLTMTQERKEHISLMVKNIYPTFQGVIAVLNQPSNDGTEQVLEDNKGDGLIIKRPWVFNHGYLMNELLLSRKIKPNQWCLYLDSPEETTLEFRNTIPDMIKDFDQNNIGALYWDNRPYLFKFNQYMEFFGTYHWGLKNITGKIVTLPDKDKYIINKRKDAPEISWCLNPIKSFICYPLSNETSIMYGKFGDSEVNNRELKRREFRTYLQEHLKLNLDTLDGLISYMKKVNNKKILPDNYFIQYCDYEFRMTELFQLKVLDMKFMQEIVPVRYKFCLSHYLNGGSGYPDNYLSYKE